MASVSITIEQSKVACFREWKLNNWTSVIHHFFSVSVLFIISLFLLVLSSLESSRKRTTARWCDILVLFAAQCILVKSDEFEMSYPLLYNVFFLNPDYVAAHFASLAPQRLRKEETQRKISLTHLFG